MKDDLPGHGISESIFLSSRTIHWVALSIHTRDLTQRALCCAQDESTGLGHIDLNLCGTSFLLLVFFCLGSGDLCLRY